MKVPGLLLGPAAESVSQPADPQGYSMKLALHFDSMHADCFENADQMTAERLHKGLAGSASYLGVSRSPRCSRCDAGFHHGLLRRCLPCKKWTL